jgi:hypothetical protein
LDTHYCDGREVIIVVDAVEADGLQHESCMSHLRDKGTSDLHLLWTINKDDIKPWRRTSSGVVGCPVARRHDSGIYRRINQSAFAEESINQSIMRMED